MSPVVIWLMVGVMGLGSSYVLGRADGVHICDQGTIDGLSNAFDQQAAIDEENAHIVNDMVTKAAQRAAVNEAIKRERKHARQKARSGCYVSRGDIRLLNAQRENKVPDVISNGPGTGGTGEFSQSSSISQQALIDGCLECDRKFNELRDKCQAVVKRFRSLNKALREVNRDR